MSDRIDGFWTEARVAILRATWPTQTASTIGEALGCTRNSVISKANRIGLGAKPRSPGFEQQVRRWSAPGPRPRPRPVRQHGFKSRQRPEPLASAPAAPPPEGGVPLLDLANNLCKWPLGGSWTAAAGALAHDPMATRFCGAGVERGSYCASHARLAYQPLVVRRRNPTWAPGSALRNGG